MKKVMDVDEYIMSSSRKYVELYRFTLRYVSFRAELSQRFIVGKLKETHVRNLCIKKRN